MDEIHVETIFENKLLDLRQVLVMKVLAFSPTPFTLSVPGESRREREREFYVEKTLALTPKLDWIQFEGRRRKSKERTRKGNFREKSF